MDKCTACKGEGKLQGVSHKIIWLQCPTCKGTGLKNPTQEQILRVAHVSYGNEHRPLSIPT